MARSYLLEIFYVLSAALVAFCGMEIVWPGMILAYFNINWLLIFWLINVILILLIKNKNLDNGQK